MSRGFCQRKNYEQEFGNKLKGAITSAGFQCKKIAAAVGIEPPTLSRRFRNPGMMPLNELKRYIKLTGLSEEDVLNYLYERE